MARSAARLTWMFAAAVALAACKPPPPPQPPPKTGERPPAAVAREAEREREALAAAVEAYVYGYPLVSWELARRAATNVGAPAGWQAPMGQLARPGGLAAASRAPSRGSLDTLAMGAWVDVSAEPWLLSLPDARGRFHAVTFRSAWNQLLLTVGGQGARGRARRIAVTGPGWSGQLPAGVREVKSPTARVRIEGRVLAVGGSDDRVEAQAWLDRVTLLPLSANPRRYLAPPGRPDASLDVTTPVRDQVQALDAVVFFKLMAALLQVNPPLAADATTLATLARIGLVPGKDFDPSVLDPSVIQAMTGVPRVAQEKIAAAAVPPAPVNGWTAAGVGASAAGQLGRAAEVWAGADQALDGVVLTAEVDGGGKPLEGKVRRALRFNRGKGPPAEVLWTLTVCDASGAPVVGTPGRNPLTSRGRFQYHRDGSLELLLQVEPPRGRESNWLQVPPGRYTLVLRLHGPRVRPPSALDGSWKPPAIGKPR